MSATKVDLSSPRFGIFALALATLGQSAFGGEFDWPQWQGPERTAQSKETGLLKEWPKDGPPLTWKIKGLGGGDSTPSVAAGRIYGMSHRGSDEIVWALSETDGKELWAVRIGAGLSAELAAIQGRPECNPDGRWGPALRNGPRGECGLSAGVRRQGGLAAGSASGLRRKESDVELPGVTFGGWR
jgi:hypothetical protein